MFGLQELDSVTAKVSDLKGKLAHVKESSKNDIASLQSKLDKVTEDSRNRIAELHKDYAEVDIIVCVFVYSCTCNVLGKYVIKSKHV